MKIGFILAILFVCHFTFSQNGNVDVIKPKGIDVLVEKKGLPIPPEVRPQVEGYRVQLFFDQEKDAVNEARSKFISKYPNIETYVSYNTYHILKVGDFRTYLEADRILSTLKDDFPTGFIVKELIYLPNLEKEDVK